FRTGHLISFPTRRFSDLAIRVLLPAPPSAIRAFACTIDWKLLTSSVSFALPPLNEVSFVLPARSPAPPAPGEAAPVTVTAPVARSEEHTSELQSPDHLVC